jgi:beta-glucanase (GH16 family)
MRLKPLCTLLAGLASATLLLIPGISDARPIRPPAPTPTPPNCGTAVLKADGSAWTCTFDEEFNGTALDATKWMPITTASNGLASGPGCYVNSPNNISVANGVLSLTARKEAAPFVCASPKGSFSTQYSTGQVSTYSKFSQTYGRFAVRAKFPASTVAGLQSSLWLWPANSLLTGLSGEIDIAEYYSNYSDRVIPYLHYLLNPVTVNLTTNTNVYTNNYYMISDASAFHEYAVEWNSTTIKIVFDGQTCLVDNLLTYGASPFNQPFFLNLTQALGITNNAFDPANTPLPATTQVDWVHIYK